MITFRANDHALLVRVGQMALTAPRRVHVVAVLRDGRLRVREHTGELRTCRLGDLRAVLPLSAAGKVK